MILTVGVLNKLMRILIACILAQLLLACALPAAGETESAFERQTRLNNRM